MSKLIKEMKEYTNADNGTGGFTYPIGVDAKNVLLKDGYYLEDALGEIDFFNKGSIMQQLKETTQAAADNSVPPNATITTPTINNATIAGSNTSISGATLNNCIIKPKLVVKSANNNIICQIDNSGLIVKKEETKNNVTSLVTLGQINSNGYNGTIYGSTSSIIGSLHLKANASLQYGLISGSRSGTNGNVNIYFPTTVNQNKTGGSATGYFAIRSAQRSSSDDTILNSQIELLISRGYVYSDRNLIIKGDTSLQSITGTSLTLSGALNFKTSQGTKQTLSSTKLDIANISATTASISNLFIGQKVSLHPITIKGGNRYKPLQDIINSKDYPSGIYPCVYEKEFHYFVKEEFAKKASQITNLNDLQGFLFVGSNYTIMLGFSFSKFVLHSYVNNGTNSYREISIPVHSPSNK